MRTNCLSIAIGLAGIVAATAPALALGKPGLWDASVTMSMPGREVRLTPEQRARMERSGMPTPSSTHAFHTKHCVTPAEAASNGMPESRKTAGCEIKSTTFVNGVFTVDTVCKGVTIGQGHLQVTYNLPTHYAGTMVFSGTTASGRPANMSMKMEGTWLSASCGNVHT